MTSHELPIERQCTGCLEWKPLSVPAQPPDALRRLVPPPELSPECDEGLARPQPGACER